MTSPPQLTNSDPGYSSDPAMRQRMRTWDRPTLRAHQLTRLNAQLTSLADHPLYQARLTGLPLQLSSLDELSHYPTLTKSDLQPERSGEPSRLFTAPPSHYVRYHQTSGSRGWPMPVLDTAADWQWWIDCWQYVLDAAAVTDHDIAMMAFSFGPFIGFWTAHDALVRRGTMVVPGGGMTSIARLQMIAQTGCTVLCGTPTYALHLANVAEQQGDFLTDSPVTRIIVAGEPGGSIPAVRHAIESRWGARVVDHAGASEVGAWGFASEDEAGLHVIESEFIAEFLPLAREPDSPLRELVLTNLGRAGGPLLRYRTGDVVDPQWDHDHACRFVKLRGGILGRTDDMVVIRGVNVFPSSIEAIVRQWEPVCEYRVVIDSEEEMDQLRIEIESSPMTIALLESQLRDRLAMRIPVRAVPEGSLPRSEGKSQRWIDQRPRSSQR